MAGSGSQRRPLALEGQGARLPDIMGIIATSPLRAKSRENPCIQGYGWEEKGPRGPFSGFRPFLTEPAKAPT